MASPPTQFESENPGFMDFVWLCFSGRWILLGCAVSGLMIGTLLPKFLHKEYQATVSFISLSKTPMQSMMDMAGGEMAALSTVLASSKALDKGSFYGSLIESSRIKTAIVEALHLAEHYKVPPAKPGADPSRPIVAARGILSKKTNLKEKVDGIIEVKVRDSDREMGMKIAGAYVDEINKFVKTAVFSEAERQAAFLQERLDIIQRELARTRDEKELAIKEALQLTLLKELEIAKGNVARERKDVAIIDLPEASLDPVYPNPFLFKLCGLLGGFVVACIWIIVAQWWKSMMLNPRNEEVAKQIHWKSLWKF